MLIVKSRIKSMLVAAPFVLLGCGGSSSDTDLSESVNQAPVANAGAAQYVLWGEAVNLSASQSSDADGDSLFYTWQIQSAPTSSETSLSASSEQDISFTPDLVGSYTLSLAVSDGELSDSDTVTVLVSQQENVSGFSYSTSVATTLVDNLFSQGIRVAGVGEIQDSQGTIRTVPAETQFQDDGLAFAADLYNAYGQSHASTSDALASLNPDDIIEIDADGELVTAYIFADNYFELFINGVGVAKDAVPFTQFNSSLVQFRVALPFVAAFRAVDWEENLGTGTESNQGSDFHPGDAGLVAVFKDSSGDTLGITDASWKAQTFYTAPVTDISCIVESTGVRSSSSCDTSAPQSLDEIYAVYWDIPDNWMETSFDDTAWPSAVTYTNDEVGVDNKPAYTNFTDVFDDADSDALFIWSASLVLDNHVLIRGTIGETETSSRSIANQDTAAL